MALAYHFGPGGTTAENFFEDDDAETLHNTPTLWSSIKHTTAYKEYTMPYPVRLLPYDIVPLLIEVA